VDKEKTESDFSRVKPKSLVFEILPMLVLSILDSRKRKNPEDPRLATYRIVEEIRTIFFSSLADKNSFEVDPEKIDSQLRPRVYNIMKQFRQPRTDDPNKDWHLDYVSEKNMKYEITEKGQDALLNYNSSLGEFIKPLLKLAEIKTNE